MYTHFDIIEVAKTHAKATAIKDRMQYIKFIEAGEKFAADHGLIIGGSAATRLLLGSEPDINDFQYNLFSDSIVTHARELSNTLYALDPQGLGHYTTVLTKIIKYLLTILVDGRELFILTALTTYRGIKTSDVLIPSECLAQFAKNEDGTPLKLLCAGPEIQLISIYNSLCNPLNASKWSELLLNESKLRLIFNQEVKLKIETAINRIEGGRQGDPANIHFYKILRDNYANGPGRVFIGPAAIEILTGKKVPGSERLQVITTGQLDGDAQEILDLAQSIGITISWKIDDPKLPLISHIRRMTIHVIKDEQKEPILDVYNSAAFDLIPYFIVSPTSQIKRQLSATHGKRVANKKHTRSAQQDLGPPLSLKIGTPFVLMRYRLIDLWIIQILMKMGVININYAKIVLNNIVSGYNIAALHYESLLVDDTEAVAIKVLPMTTYIGRLENPELVIKRASKILTKTKFHPPAYYPGAIH
jgi:hypothetical protein